MHPIHIWCIQAVTNFASLLSAVRSYIVVLLYKIYFKIFTLHMSSSHSDIFEKIQLMLKYDGGSNYMQLCDVMHKFSYTLDDWEVRFPNSKLQKYLLIMDINAFQCVTLGYCPLLIVDLWQCCICSMYKIGCNPMLPLYGALLVPVRVTRGALVAHRYTYAPARCRTSQYRRTCIVISVSLWTISLTPYSMVWDWRVSTAGLMLFYCPN